MAQKQTVTAVTDDSILDYVKPSSKPRWLKNDTEQYTVQFFELDNEMIGYSPICKCGCGLESLTRAVAIKDRSGNNAIVPWGELPEDIDREIFISKTIDDLIRDALEDMKQDNLLDKHLEVKICTIKNAPHLVAIGASWTDERQPELIIVGDE